MKTPSEYLWSRRSLLLVCFVVAAILIFQAIRIWVDAMRGLMSAKVYEEIVLRPKRVFSFPFAHWMAGDLRAAIDASFESDRTRATGVLNPAAVQNVWHRFLTHPGRVGWSRVWSLFIMQRWCETMRITR